MRAGISRIPSVLQSPTYRFRVKHFSKPATIPVVTLRCKISPPRIRSFFFQGDAADSSIFSFKKDGASAESLPATVPSSSQQKDSVPKAKSATRIRPSRDMIKLEDRLYYLLQPPLESLLVNGTIEFPFAPFPYQFAGIAFLFARQMAILADEMGLGKTMQCISTIRLLLRSGQIKRMLLICPKPLVTNWVKEFSLWAPEIPICVVGGNQANRTWKWKDAQAPVKIANYELMTRDAATIDEYALEYDLVVLDEAQRIKNRQGATSKAICSIPRKRSWALTGTPVENSTNDLVGIFEFLSSRVFE